MFLTSYFSMNNEEQQIFYQRGTREKVFEFINFSKIIRPTLSYNIKGKGFPLNLIFFILFFFKENLGVSMSLQSAKLNFFCEMLLQFHVHLYEEIKVCSLYRSTVATKSISVGMSCVVIILKLEMRPLGLNPEVQVLRHWVGSCSWQWAGSPVPWAWGVACQMCSSVTWVHWLKVTDLNWGLPAFLSWSAFPRWFLWPCIHVPPRSPASS